MSRADELKNKMADLQKQLDELAPHEQMTTRELARAAEVSPNTAARFKAGDVTEMQLSTVAKLMRFTRSCPLCGADHEPEAWPSSSTVDGQADAEPPLFQTSRTAEEGDDAVR